LPDTGEQSTLVERAGYDIEQPLYDPWTHLVVGAAWNEDEQEQHFFEPDLQSAYERAAAAFGAQFMVELVTWSRDRRRFVIYAERGLDGGGYYIFTLANNAIVRLGMLYPAIAEAPFGERQAITYPARDGQRIPAYLTLPEGEQRNLPLVLLVHGGPHGSRDTLEFDWIASFLASRGYAVVQPNYRGSDGYGAAWKRAGYRQWGGLMQTDVEDAVAALVRANIADPARVCIVGASYGGYAALAGATLTPERYACAASVNGVSDLMQMITTESLQTGRNSMSSDYWRLSIGDRSEDRGRIREASPVNLTERVRAPILLIHGVDDTVVPISQSERMHDRLRAAGKNVRFVRLTGDDHWLSDAGTRIQMLREIESFLAAHLAAPN
jgi:dipeptidyl aminopeptidase/acylaminoacyl peptidase